MPSLTVMTWDVKSLFLPEGDDTDQKKKQRFQSKLAALAAVIEQQQPDVLALKEIGAGGAVHPGILKVDEHSTDACG